MTSVGTIESSLSLKDQQFNAAIKRDVANTDKLSVGFSRLSKSSKKADQGINKLASGFANLAVAAGAGAVAMKGFTLAEGAAGSQKAIQAFEATGGSVDKLQGAFSNMIGQAELIKKKNLADTMGINGNTFKELATIAQASATKTGQSFEFMFDSIVVGTARSSKLILDNLGIIVSQKQANERWAKANKTVVSSMTDMQKKLAFTADVLMQGKKLTKEMADAGISLVDKFAQARAAISDVGLVVGKVLKPGFEIAIDLFLMVTDKIKIMGKWFDRLNKDGRKIVGVFSAVAVGVTLLVAGFGALAAVVGGLTVALPAIITGFTAIGGAIAAAMAPVSAFILVVLAVITLAGVLRDVWEKHGDAIENKFVSMANVARAAFTDLKNKAVKVFEGLQAPIANVVTFIADNFDSLWDFIVDGATIVPQALGKVIEGITRQVLGLVLFIEKFTKKFEESKAGKLIGFKAPDFGGLKQDAKNIALQGARFNSEIKNAVDLIKEFTNPRKIIATAISGKEETAGVFEKAGKVIGDGLETAADSAVRGWKLLFEDAKKAFGGFFDDAKTVQVQTKKKQKEDKPTGKGKGAAKDGVIPVAIVADNGPSGSDVFNDILRANAESLATGGGLDIGGLIGSGLAALGGASAGGVGMAGQIGAAVVDAIRSGFEAVIGGIVSLTGDARIGSGLMKAVEGFFIGLGVVAIALLSPVILAIATPLLVLGAVFAVPIAIFGTLAAVGIAVIGFLVALAAAIPLLIGGVFAVGAGLLSLATETESFKKFQDAFAASVDRIILALEPLFEPMIALAGLFDMVVSLLVTFAESFASGDAIARVLFESFKFGAVILAGFLVAVGFTQNVMIGFGIIVLQVADFFRSIIGLAPAFTGLITRLSGMAVDVDKLALQFRNLAGATFQENIVRGESLVLQEQQNETLGEVNDTTANVPETFKVTEERFRAIQAGLGDTFGDTGAVQAAGGGISIGGDLNITIQGAADDIVAQIEEAVGSRRAEQTGNANGRGSRSGGGL